MLYERSSCLIYISAITCPPDNRIVSGDSFNRVDNIQAIAPFCSEQDGILVFSPYLTTCRHEKDISIPSSQGLYVFG